MKKFNLRGRIRLTGAITLLACLFFLAGAANATMIYDNLHSPTGGADPLKAQFIGRDWWDGGPLFNSFSVGPAGFNFSEVHLLLKRDPGYSDGHFSVYLYKYITSSTPPSGTPLLTIGTLNDMSLSETLSIVGFSLATPYPLAANTRYWLVLNSTTGSTANWAWSLDQDAVGVAGEFTGHKSWVYDNSCGPYQMAIPLPGAVWLLGSGLAGLGLWRGRKLFKKA